MGPWLTPTSPPTVAKFPALMVAFEEDCVTEPVFTPISPPIRTNSDVLVPPALTLPAPIDTLTIDPLLEAARAPTAAAGLVAAMLTLSSLRLRTTPPPS